MNKDINMAVVVLAGCCVAACSGVARAAQVTVAGAYNLGTLDPLGSTGPLGVDGFVSTYFTGGTTDDNRLDGRITATNESVGGGSGQRLSLVIDAFRWSGTNRGLRTLTVMAVQDFAVADGMALGSWTQHLNGQAELGAENQSASAIVSSCALGNNLPEVAWASPNGSSGVMPFARSSLVQVTGGVSSVFRVVTCFQFTITPDCGRVDLGVGCAGSDINLILTPVPQAGLAGVGGLACIGLVSMQRRRMNSAV